MGATLFAVAVLATLLAAGSWSADAVGTGLSRASVEALLRTLGVVAASGAVGSFLLAILLSRGSAEWAVEARPSLLAGARWSALWGVESVGSVVLMLLADARTDALAVGSHTGVDPAGAVRDAVRAGVLTAWAAGTAAVLARSATRRPTVLLCLALAYAGLVAAAFTGHSGHADARPLAVLSIAVHVLAATTWAGGLLALLVHGARGGAVVPVVRAFSGLALLSFVAVGISGAVSLASRVPLAELGATGPYGVLVVGKVCGLALLGVLGALHRRHSLKRLEAGSGAAFWALVAGELVVMAAVIGLAVALGRTPV